MQAASERGHANNEEKASVFITVREIKDSRLLPPAITVALINEAFEPSSVGAGFQLSNRFQRHPARVEAESETELVLLCQCQKAESRI